MMLDDTVRATVNDAIGRMMALDEMLGNAYAFRALLEDLRSRDLSVVQGPHVGSISMVRAGLLRAAITSIMAAVDKNGKDRASIGQIVSMLEELNCSGFLSDALSERWPPGNDEFGTMELGRAKIEWEELLATSEFQDCKNFRDGAVAHMLMLDTPTVPVEAYFRVFDAARTIADRIHRICGFNSSAVRKHDQIVQYAGVFWCTYFKGMMA
jgi:hypothetical protein